MSPPSLLQIAETSAILYRRAPQQTGRGRPVSAMRITGGTVTYPSVHIVEECMREGMQIESTEIATADKIRLLDALSQTGLQTIVVGSFVSPRYTPQMAAIDELVAGFTPRAG